MPVHGGKLAARALKAAGVKVIFTLSGGHIMPIYDGCLDEGIDIIDVRHEQAAVHAADSWARCNPGSIGVAAITAGPAEPRSTAATGRPRQAIASSTGHGRAGQRRPSTRSSCRASWCVSRASSATSRRIPPTSG